MVASMLWDEVVTDGRGDLGRLPAEVGRGEFGAAGCFGGHAKKQGMSGFCHDRYDLAFFVDEGKDFDASACPILARL